MSKQNRLGDDDGDFEIPDIDIPGAGEVVKEGLRNRKSRGWTIAAIIIGILIIGYCSETSNRNSDGLNRTVYGDSPSQPQRSASRASRSSPSTSSSARYVLIGEVTGVDPNLTFIRVRINSSASVQIGQEVLIAHSQPTRYEYRFAAVVDTLNGNLAGLTPKGSIQYFEVGMNVYSTAL